MICKQKENITIKPFWSNSEDRIIDTAPNIFNEEPGHEFRNASFQDRGI
jgi:hypothetical protein